MWGQTVRGRQEEYALARTWLERELWPVLTKDRSAPLPRDRLLLVPCNHDVDRNQADTVARMVQNGFLTGRHQSQIAAVLESPDQRGVLLKRHAAYLEFYGELALAAFADEVPVKDRFRLGLVGDPRLGDPRDPAWQEQGFVLVPAVRSPGAAGDRGPGRQLLGVVRRFL